MLNTAAESFRLVVRSCTSSLLPAMSLMPSANRWFSCDGDRLVEFAQHLSQDVFKVDVEKHGREKAALTHFSCCTEGLIDYVYEDGTVWFIIESFGHISEVAVEVVSSHHVPQAFQSAQASWSRWNCGTDHDDVASVSLCYHSKVENLLGGNWSTWRTPHKKDLVAVRQ